MTVLKAWIWIYVCVVMIVSITSCTHTQPPYEPPTKEERGFWMTPFKNIPQDDNHLAVCDAKLEMCKVYDLCADGFNGRRYCKAQAKEER